MGRTYPIRKSIRELENSAKTVVGLSKDGKLTSIVGVADAETRHCFGDRREIRAHIGITQ
jgi:hypothetical protein